MDSNLEYDLAFDRSYNRTIDSLFPCQQLTVNPDDGTDFYVCSEVDDLKAHLREPASNFDEWEIFSFNKNVYSRCPNCQVRQTNINIKRF